ncbi:MAG: alpha/beta hydrolase [Bacteroidetes bacterium]|nr:alpha/beta hydrolase [Bacteroidota bacterium]
MVKYFLVLLLLVSNFLNAQSPEMENTRPFVLGRIDQLNSKILQEDRILNIYLPEGYSSKDTTRYPVVYLLDGSADEDFIHITGIYQFYTFPWMNRVPKSIIVGIATVDRRRDYTFPTSLESDKKLYPTTGHSAAFIDFIEKELQPYIQNKYKTSTSRTLIGQSLGGLLATQILIEKPYMFDKYIIVSPSLWWNNGSLLKVAATALKEYSRNKLSIYIGVGKEGLTPTKVPRVMEVDANVLAEKLQGLHNKNLEIFFDYLPEENHATILHPAVINALKILYSSEMIR